MDREMAANYIRELRREMFQIGLHHDPLSFRGMSVNSTMIEAMDIAINALNEQNYGLFARKSEDKDGDDHCYIPINVEVLTKKCHLCSEFKPSIDIQTMYGDGKEVARAFVAECASIHKCRYLQEFLKESRDEIR